MNLTQRLAKAQQEGSDSRFNRQDGYTNDSPVFSFQRAIETSGNCDYHALRATLQWARNRSVSFDDLMHHYRKEAK